MTEDAASATFRDDEVKQLFELTDVLCAGAEPHDEPELVVCLGTIASGKTTFRRRELGRGYVQLDELEALVAVTRALGRRHPRFADFLRAARTAALERAIAEKLSIAIELVDAELLLPLLDSMKALGYRIVVRHLEIDPAEGYRRHVKAVEEDPEYLSAYFTEEDTVELFYRHFGLDTRPLDEHARAKG